MDYHKLNDFILSSYKPGVHNVLMIDEVQLCDNFEKAINSIHAKHIYDIFITGSNAFLLSSDLATLFTGRTIEIMVYPFSFAEYREFWKTDKNVDDDFDDYLRNESELSRIAEFMMDNVSNILSPNNICDYLN